jgi:hypothetical protein
MTTWADFLGDLRNDLQDTAVTNPRWSDKTLWVYTKDAVRDYSTWFPKRIDQYAMAPANGAYPLPLNFLLEIFVEAPLNKFLEKRREIPGTRLKQLTAFNGYYARENYYYVEGGNLYLGSPSDEVFLTYQASRDVPISETDTAFVFEVPDTDLEVVRLYVKAKVYEQMRSRSASLDRFKQGQGARDDNPITPEVADLMAVYHQKIAERFPGGNIELYRSGRMK